MAVHERFARIQLSGKGRMPMRRFVALAALAVALVCALVPSVSFTEDRDTVQLAKVIYALARDELCDKARDRHGGDEPRGERLV